MVDAAEHPHALLKVLLHRKHVAFEALDAVFELLHALLHGLEVVVELGVVIFKDVLGGIDLGNVVSFLHSSERATMCSRGGIGRDAYGQRA